MEEIKNAFLTLLPLEEVPANFDIIDHLKTNLLHDDRITKQYLQRMGAPEEEAVCELAYIDAIMKSILQKSNVISEGNYFSEQEETLMTFAYGVQACKAGQNDAISNYYRDRVPEEFKIRNRENQDPVSRLAVCHSRPNSRAFWRR